MPLRTPAQYVESLRDGRVVYYRGKRIEDVTAHPYFRVAIDHAAIDYQLAEDPEHRDLAVATDPETGGEISRLYLMPRNTQDLLDRTRLIALTTAKGGTMVTLIKEIGADALNGLHVVAAQMDKALGTSVSERVHAFYRHCVDNDLAVCVAQSDPKGDRALRPSEQEHPDYYVRIVERRDDGIVVRGAKLHTSVSVNSNEMVVLPTRNLDERDADYAVAFAVPVNTPGLKLITSTYSREDAPEDEFPLSSKHRMLETLTVFDDVFVPWERVFLDGQHEYAGPMALTFVDFHRYTAVSYKQPLIDLLVGSALLMADYNGIGRVGHVREKIGWLAIYNQTIKGLLSAAAHNHQVVPPGIAVPNRLYTNLSKLHFAEHYHTALGHVQDITGGLLVTTPGVEELQNPETRDDILHYLGGRKGVSAEDRLKAIRMVADLTASDFGGYQAVLAIHAEGSIEAEKLAIAREFDVKSALEYARAMAGID